jgi:hypothetical protein
MAEEIGPRAARTKKAGKRPPEAAAAPRFRDGKGEGRPEADRRPKKNNRLAGSEEDRQARDRRRCWSALGGNGRVGRQSRGEC